MLQHVGDNAAQFTDRVRQRLGGVDRRDPARPARARAAGRRRSSSASRCSNIDDLHADRRTASGVVNILAADKLMNSPQLYATLPAVAARPSCSSTCPKSAIRDKPKLVFFFDEAHLLFNDAPKALLEKIEQVVRLIRSKGVGVYFVTQNPLDIPDTVLGQLGNRVQHALRAFTPRDQKAVKAAAETMRAESEARHREGDHRARRRRGAGLASSTRRAARASSSARSSLPPGSRDRPDHAGRAQGGDRAARWSPASTRRRSTASRPTRSSRRARGATSAGGDRRPRRGAAAGGGIMDSLKGIRSAA